MQVGVWATQRISKRNSTGNASWGVGPTQRISKRNSTGNASWGVGANTEAYEKSAYNNVQVGGANKEKLDSQFLQTVRVGVGQR